MSAEQYGAYSVLMSVYSKENPTWLRLAIESMQTQTLPTSDFVLVCDGPLTPELDGVIAEKQRQMGTVLTVVRLEKKHGLGQCAERRAPVLQERACCAYGQRRYLLPGSM